MRKYLFIIALAFIFQIKALAQTPESITLDSLKIDSLQNILPSLRDTARINCLNLLAEASLDRDGYKIKRAADSAYPYAIMANSEAKKINYKRGIANSLVNMNQIAFLNVIHNNNMSIDNKVIDNSVWFSKWEEYMSQLFSVAQELNNNEIWGLAYYSQANLYGKKKNIKGVIDAFKKSLFYFQKSGNEERESELTTWLCMAYSDNGEYEKGFDYCKRSLDLAKKIGKQTSHTDMKDYMLQQALMNMSELYTTAGDYETALNYLRESERLYRSHKSSGTWSVEGDMAELFKKTGQYDSVLLYEKPIKLNGGWMDMWTAKHLGETYFMRAAYDSSLIMFNKAIDGFRKNKNANTKGLKNSLSGAAKTLLAKKKYNQAFPLVRESLSIAQNEGDRVSVRDNFEILSDLFYRTGKNDSAYLYHKKYTNIKDSILNRQFYWRLNNYKKEAEEQKKISQFNLLNKDNQLKEQKLKQEAFVKNSLIIGIILLFLLGIFIVWNLSLKRKNDKLRFQKDLKMQQMENDKKHAELKQQTVELEMQALRAQMNPHFIFNCLSSINKFILKNEPDAASDYLTRFSRLIRMVLINSQKPLITLEDELDMLTIYLDMERLRFKKTFDYNIIFSNRVDTGSLYIPSLLL
ncbi:MAG: histidine kinase, partial [Saprospiraceae bacterium]